MMIEQYLCLLKLSCFSFIQHHLSLLFKFPCIECLSENRILSTALLTPSLIIHFSFCKDTDSPIVWNENRSTEAIRRFKRQSNTIFRRFSTCHNLIQPKECQEDTNKLKSSWVSVLKEYLIDVRVEDWDVICQ